MKEKTTAIVRFATLDDAPVMMELIKELALYEKAPDEVTVSMEHFIESGFGPNPVWKALVAVIPALEDNIEQIVGLGLYYIRYSTWKGQRMYIEDVIVSEAWRGKGIGSLLMDALIDEARKKKLSGIMWQVLDWNEPAINFYKKYDVQFDNSWINVSKAL